MGSITLHEKLKKWPINYSWKRSLTIIQETDLRIESDRVWELNPNGLKSQIQTKPNWV